MSVRHEVARERRQKVKLNGRKLMRPEWGQLAVRFLFGAGIAVGAGLVGLKQGPRVGGVFLAFPAILPAALTLLERSDGTTKTDVDAVGASLGAVALLLFAVAITVLPHGLGVAAIVVAAVVWVVAACLLFGVARRSEPLLTRRS